MSAAAIASALLPQGQGGVEPAAATRGALAVLDAVFGAILKGVDSQDAGSQVATRNFGASETNSDSALPQPQGSAVKASASSPTATFEASLAALDYEAMAGTDGSSAIATQAKLSQSQTATQATTSPRRWTPTASPSQSDSRKAWTSRTATNPTNAPPTSTADANSPGASTRLASTRAAAQIEIGQTVASTASAASAAIGGTTAANAAALPFHSGAVHGSVKARSSETRKGASEIAATDRNVADAAQLSVSPTASNSIQVSASATSPASPSPTTAACAANNQTKAPVLELGPKFWTWPKGDASDTDVTASHWDLSGSTPLNNLLAADSSLGFQGMEATAHLAVAGSLPVKMVSAESSPTSTSTPSSRARSTNGAPAPTASAEPQSASASASLLQRQQSVADASASKRDEFVASTASTTKGIDASGGVASATTSAMSLPVSGLADFIAGEAESMSAPPSADGSSGAAAATPQTPGATKVKELVISLEPENLGKMSLRLRLANGKLSVSIGVENQQTLAALEGESGAIASRLAGGQQSLESLTIHPQEGSITDAGNSGTGDFSGSRAPADRNSESKDLPQGGGERKPVHPTQNSSGAMAAGNADMLVV